MARKIDKLDLVVAGLMVALAGAALAYSMVDFVRGQYGSSLLEVLACVVLLSTVWSVFRPQIKILLSRK